MNAADHTSPTISVLLPVFNGERYLRAALESVINQSFRDFELLALDGGSKDRSLSILRKYETKDSRVHVLIRENLALIPSLNELIAISRGPYLARMDADDICRPQRFEKQVAYLDTHPECVAVGSKTRFIDSGGMPIWEFGNRFTHDEIDSGHLAGIGCQICHPTVIMRRKAVMQVGRYREECRNAEDIDLFLRLAEIGKLANLPEVLLDYRYHLASTSFTYNDELRNNTRQVVKEARSRRGMTDIFEMPELEPIKKYESREDLHRKWAWWALSGGNVATARKHAILALVRNPINIENLRIAACALRGH